MIVFLTLVYVALLAVLVRMKVLPNSKATWLSVIVWMVLLFIVLFIPMQWGAPAGQARIFTYSVQIIPNVSGVVTSVPVAANAPLKEGDVLFTIDDTVYRSTVDAKEAQLKFQEKRLGQFSQLERADAGTRFQVEETQATVDRLRAEVEAAVWNLQETVVRAPSDGFVTYLGLRPGQRVTNLPLAPAMTFVDTERRVIGAQINQIHIRNVRIGQPVEIAFKTIPGRIFTGKVFAILEATAASQVLISGSLPQAQQVQADPFFVRIELDSDDALEALIPGTVGTAAIYTDATKPTHVIRKVMIRMESILNYAIPTL